MIVETDRLAPTEHVLVCPGTSHLRYDVGQRRIHVEPGEGNGLRAPTQFQADKVTTTRRSKCGVVIGRLDEEALDKLNGILALVLGLID